MQSQSEAPKVKTDNTDTFIKKTYGKLDFANGALY